MRTRLTTTALAAVLLMAPAEASQREAAPNNVRAEIVQVAGDSITWEVQWNPPPRGRLQAPVTGYEVEIVAESDTGAGRIAGADTLGADARLARVTVYHDCADDRNRYHARVRATGAFSAPAPWGTSDPVVIACDATPPGAPEVQADTLPVDTVSSEPDDWETTIQPLRSWVTLDGDGFRSEARGEAARLCAYTVRDGVKRRAGWTAGGWQSPLRPRIGQEEGATPSFQAVDGTQACWDVTILAAR